MEKIWNFVFCKSVFCLAIFLSAEPAWPYDVHYEMIETTIEWSAPMDKANLMWGITPIATRNGRTICIATLDVRLRTPPTEPTKLRVD